MIMVRKGKLFLLTISLVMFILLSRDSKKKFLHTNLTVLILMLDLRNMSRLFPAKRTLVPPAKRKTNK